MSARPIAWCLSWLDPIGRRSWWPTWRFTDDVPGYPRFFYAYWGRLQLSVRLP